LIPGRREIVLFFTASRLAHLAFYLIGTGGDFPRVKVARV
jgi:hypothetical protein